MPVCHPLSPSRLGAGACGWGGIFSQWAQAELWRMPLGTIDGSRLKGFARLYRPRTLVRTWGTRPGGWDLWVGWWFVSRGA